MRTALIFAKYFSVWNVAGLLLTCAFTLTSPATARSQTTIGFLDGDGELRVSTLPMRAPAKSKLAFRVQIPKAPVVEALNRFDTYREVGQVMDCPKLLSVQVCNYSYDLSFTRDGVAELDFTQQTIVARIPMKLTGDIAYRTKASEAASRNTVNGRFHLVLATKLSIEERWCVDVDTEISVDWIDRPKLTDSAVLNAIIAEVRPIDGQVEQNIGSILSKERMAAIKNTLCQSIREQVSKFWRPHVIQFSAKNLGSMYAHIVPRSIKYSGPTISDSAMTLGIHLDAETSVGFKRRVIDIGELPPLVPADSIREQVLIDIPAFMSLQDLKSAVMQIVSANKFDLPLPVRGMEAVLHNVEPFVTSDGRLEFKVDYSVGFKMLPLRAWGEATVSGKPDVDSENSRIVFNQIEAKISLTNGILSKLFDWALPRAEQALRLKIAEIGKYDVKKELDRSTEELRRQVAQLDTLTGFQLELKDFTPLLGSLLAVENSGLALYARASGGFEARMREVSAALFEWLQEYEGPFKRPYKVVNDKQERPYLREAKGANISLRSGKAIDWDAGKLRLSECRWFENDARYMWCNASMRGPRGARVTGWIRQYHLAPSS